MPHRIVHLARELAAAGKIAQHVGRDFPRRGDDFTGKLLSCTLCFSISAAAPRH
jgi:hypothetical protein